MTGLNSVKRKSPKRNLEATVNGRLKMALKAKSNKYNSKKARKPGKSHPWKVGLRKLKKRRVYDESNNDCVNVHSGDSYPDFR